MSKKTEKELNTECCICLTEVNKNTEGYIKLYCKHLYHDNCLVQWLQQSNATNNCPICRNDIKQMFPQNSNIYLCEVIKKDPNTHILLVKDKLDRYGMLCMKKQFNRMLKGFDTAEIFNSSKFLFEKGFRISIVTYNKKYGIALLKDSYFNTPFIIGNVEINGDIPEFELENIESLELLTMPITRIPIHFII